jgi:uncharacterized protein YbbC (DUF1343 family)
VTKSATKKINVFRYAVQIEGVRYYTFELSLAERAKKAQDNDVALRIQFNKGQYGNDIMTMDEVIG